MKCIKNYDFQIAEQLRWSKRERDAQRIMIIKYTAPIHSQRIATMCLFPQIEREREREGKKLTDAKLLLCLQIDNVHIQSIKHE